MSTKMNIKLLILILAFIFVFSIAFADSYIEIGTGTARTYYTPWNTLYNYSITQTIYLQSEIGTPIDIGKISFNAGSWPEEQTAGGVKIWMGHTTLETYSSTDDWIDTATLTQVFDGDITVIGEGWFDIILDTTFSYNNIDNLVISFYDPSDGNFGSGYKFYYTSHANRMIRGYSDSVNPPEPSSVSYYIANIRLGYTNSIVTGIVSNEDTGEPIEGAVVSILEHSDETGLNGVYLLEGAPIGLRPITCIAEGYYDFAGEVEVISDTTVIYDIAMNDLDYGSIAGYVTELNTGDSIHSAIVEILGTEFSDTTDVTGYYEIADILVGTYDVLARKESYGDSLAEGIEVLEGETTPLDFALPFAPPLIIAISGKDQVVPIYVAPIALEQEYDIIYDDGEEGSSVTFVSGGLWAVRFTPNSYPCGIKKGYINIGWGNYPQLLPFEVAVFDDDGPDGFPSTELGRVTVNPTDYHFVEADLEPLNLYIDDGDFYIVYIQPIDMGISFDPTPPTVNRSYCFYDQNWILAPAWQDLMIRSTVTGFDGQPTVLAENGQFIEFGSEEISEEMMKMFITSGDYDLPEKGIKPVGNGEFIKRYKETTLNRYLTGYKIYKSFDGGTNFEFVHEIEDDGLQNWNDHDVWNTITYLYYATGIYYGVEESGPSDTVYATPYATGGSLEGTVTVAETGSPLEGAVIHCSAYNGISDYTGYYYIPNIYPDTYSVTCDAEGYNVAYAENVEILLGETTTQDFSLTAPTMEIEPTTIIEAVEPGDTLTTYITVHNSGNGPLTYIANIEGDSLPRNVYSEKKSQYITAETNVRDMFCISPEIISNKSNNCASVNTNISDWYSMSNTPGSKVNRFDEWYAYADISQLTTVTWATPERVTYFNPVDFGLDYPFQITKLKHYFYEHPDYPWDDATFHFKIFAADGETLLYESGDIEAEHLVEIVHELSTPVTITYGGFYFGVDPVSGSGYPSSCATDQTSGNSYYGSSGSWVFYDKEFIQGVYLIEFNPWIVIEPPSGIVEAGSTDTLSVIFDATDIEHGTILNAVITFSSDPNVGIFTIPVQLEVTNVGVDDIPILSTKLNSNFPNPFTHSTTISFSLKEKSTVKLYVYNIKGQLVASLVDEELKPGADYTIIWDGKSDNKKLANGIYFYKFETKDKSFIKKMILMR